MKQDEFDGIQNPLASSEHANSTGAFPITYLGASERSNGSSAITVYDGIATSTSPECAQISEFTPEIQPGSQQVLTSSSQYETASSLVAGVHEEELQNDPQIFSRSRGQAFPSISHYNNSPQLDQALGCHDQMESHSGVDVQSSGTSTLFSEQHLNPEASSKRRMGNEIGKLQTKTKKSRLDDDHLALPPVFGQPKLVSNLSAQVGTQESIDPDPKDLEASQLVDIFPGGRGVPSPIYGFRERHLPSPLVELSFSTKLAVNRNPFQSTSQRPDSSWILTRQQTSLRKLQSASISSCEIATEQGVFDTPESESPIVLGKSEKYSLRKNKTTKGFSHKRSSLARANFTSPKDVATANQVLAGLNGLSGVIPKKEAMWLGATLWIFTVEQLDCLLSRAGGRVRESALLQALARSSLCCFTATPPIQCDKGSAITGSARTGPELDRAGSLDEYPIVPRELDLPNCAISNIESTKEASDKGNHGGEKPVEIKSIHQPFFVENEIESERTENVGVVKSCENLSPESVNARSSELLPNATKNSSPVNLELAVDIIERWKDCLRRFRSAPLYQRPVDKFLLSEAIGQLLPNVLREFLGTVDVLTLHDFISLKKTESSPLISSYKDWRNHCMLPPLKGHCLSRHLFGMCIRLEKAVTSIPPVDAETRRWMGTVLVTLTGSAKEFIVDECKIFRVETFLEGRTKEWADRLVMWRNQQNLPHLKGSGKVAMISGWKASLKDSLDVENGFGRELSENSSEPEMPGSPFGESDNEEAPQMVDDEENNSIRLMVASETPDTAHPQRALHSKEFLVSVLRSENVQFLNSIGIWTAEQLIECDKQPSSPAIRALINYRTNYRADPAAHPATASTCVRLIYDWTQRVKTRLKEIRCDLSGSLPKKRGPKFKGGKEPDSPLPVAPHQESISRPIRSKNSSKVFIDPMDALSANSRSFLESISINDANTFLGTKTSVISNAYITWRENQNMPSLKGYGAIATISGWKAQIRRAAQGAGKHSLAATEPADCYGNGYQLLSADQPQHAQPSFFDSLVVSPAVSPQLLFGMPTKKLFFQGPTGIVFAFELSVRNSKIMKNTLSTFLTYLGRVNKKSIHHNQAWNAELDQDQLPILVDVSDMWVESRECCERSSFSSLGGGSGVFDLGKHAVFRMPDDRLKCLKSDILDLLDREGLFSFQAPSMGLSDPRTNSVAPANVFLFDAPLRRSCQIFYQSLPLERGQVVELVSSSVFMPCVETTFVESSSVLLRATILNQISTLIALEVNELLQWVCDFCVELNQSTLRKRRLHWIATSLLRQLDVIDDASVRQKCEDPPDRTETREMANPVLMTSHNLNEVRNVKESTKLRDFNFVLEEIIEEIQSRLLVDSGGFSYSDPSRRCHFAITLCEECLRAASSILVSNAPELQEIQEALNQKYCELVKNAIAALNAYDTELESLTLRRLNQAGEIERVIATGTSCHEPVFRPFDEVRSGDADINRSWYVNCQIMSTVHAVASSVEIPWFHRTDHLVHDYAKLVSEVVDSTTSDAREILITSTVEDWSASYRFLDRSLFDGCSCVASIPSSLPLFLGLVWPKLRSRFGWRIDAGDIANDVIFLSSGQRNRVKRRNDVIVKMKQERRYKRMKLHEKLKDIGYGDVPKLTKRLVIRATTAQSIPSKPEVSIRGALEMLGDFLLSKCETQRSRIDSIVNGVCKCFDDLITILNPSTFVNEADEPLSRRYGCDQLITMLLVIPRVLRQSDLPLRQIEDTTHLIKDIVNYLTDHYELCFDAMYRPLAEVYEECVEENDYFLLSKLDAIVNRTSNVLAVENGGMKEVEALVRDLLEPSDVNDLTEFTAMAMRQMAPCRAGPNDSSKKGRKHVPVGYPGMVCIHCWGVNEGKYFFTSPDSLGTAGGVIYSHLARCPMFPPSELKKLTIFKGQQAEARKHLRYGAQASYFNRLWRRLHSSRSICETPVVIMRQSSETVDNLGTKYDLDDEQDSSDHKSLEFKSHIDVLEYLEKSNFWKDDIEFITMINLYYDTLHHGGRIFNTDAMPCLFSSEWLLAKALPTSLHKRYSGSVWPG